MATLFFGKFLSVVDFTCHARRKGLWAAAEIEFLQLSFSANVY
jgi:hypothetical protein